MHHISVTYFSRATANAREKKSHHNIRFRQYHSVLWVLQYDEINGQAKSVNILGSKKPFDKLRSSKPDKISTPALLAAPFVKTQLRQSDTAYFTIYCDIIFLKEIISHLYCFKEVKLLPPHNYSTFSNEELTDYEDENDLKMKRYDAHQWTSQAHFIPRKRLL